MRCLLQQPRAGKWHTTGRSVIALWTKSISIDLGSRGVTHPPVLSPVGIPSNRRPRLTLTGYPSSAGWELGGDCADTILREGGDVTRRTLFSFFPFPFSLHLHLQGPFATLSST